MLNSGVMETFHNAGALISSPGCGGCASGQIGMTGEGEVQISTSNRNFKGRMGSPQAKIYLSSTATAVASAIEGKITDPRRYL